MKLKFVLVAVCSLLVFSVQAATINLEIGDVITLQPNTLTTVTCGGTTEARCQLPIKNFETKLGLCKDQLNSVEDCLGEYWPSFKRTNNKCIEEAYQHCVDFCKTSPLHLDCADLCK